MEDQSSFVSLYIAMRDLTPASGNGNFVVRKGCIIEMHRTGFYKTFTVNILIVPVFEQGVGKDVVLPSYYRNTPRVL